MYVADEAAEMSRFSEVLKTVISTKSAILVLCCTQCLLWDSCLRLKKDVQSLAEGRGQVRRVKRESQTYTEANVEFIHPKLREEMDTESEDPENPWVWLTSYSRIPVRFPRYNL